MKIVISLVVGIAMFGTGCASSPQVLQCRTDLGKWVPMIRAVYASPDCQGDGSPSCPFVEPIRNLSTSDLSRIPFAAESCGKVDQKNEFMYERVAARAENIVVMRAGQFMLQSGQDGAYHDWELSHKSKATGEDTKIGLMPKSLASR
jgi:hypothetical protein